MALKQVLSGLGLWFSLVVCAWIYSPGLGGPFLLDDLVNLEGLQVLQQGARFTPDVVAGNNSGPLGRPVSMLTFAGSYLSAGGFDSRVFREHNLALHLVTGALVCWLSLLILRATHTPDAEVVAVFAASFWLLSPLMQSTVLYVIQRMAQLACVLVVLGLICFCKARLTNRKASAAVLVASALVCLVVAVFAKETAIVGLPLVLLLELAIFRPGDPSTVYRVVERMILAGVASTGVAVCVALSVGWSAGGVFDYSSRDFTLTQRVLTEARVLLDYAAALLWPFKGGFGIYHDDFPISRGLLDPPSTLAAILAVACVALSAVVTVARRRARVLGAGLLFFLVAHGPESTILPLEIYFEHRNYLPAVGLCLALGWSGARLARALPELKALVAVLSVLFLMGAAAATGLRANYWSNTALFAALAVNEHPRSERANIAYATALAQAGDPALATVYNRLAGEFSRDPPVVVPLREMWLHCLSGRSPPERVIRDVESRMQRFGNPRIDEVINVLVESILDGRCEPSVGRSLADVIFRFRNSGGRLTDRVTGLAVKLENFLGRFPRALRYAEELRQRDPRSPTAQLMVAYLAGQTGDSGLRDEALRALRALECEGVLSLDQQASLAALQGDAPDDACGAPK